MNERDKDLEYTEKLIDEYLQFRGFADTRKCFASEKMDKNKSHMLAKKIVQQLLTCIHNYDDEELMNLWDHFSRVLFVKLDEDIAWNVSKLEFSLKCFYIVNAIQNNQKEKVLNFFQKYGEEMAGNRHWQGWFSIVYCKNPSQDPVFKDFFSKSWQESFNLSLHNFFSIIFASIDILFNLYHYFCCCCC
eukprot:TRINITY_DN2901_c0_g1_i1.p1 TRINITY_DN2901_c0_g1~~TRINITY_DN2901_c0_g1_i1.p1  ORF type:complete len:189 (-),score=23.94 TRINITY_DN2901_c0_g1_i1:436-1002(-)